jgi:5-enolpyruvylshikimate-3-phosphate synthase
VKNLKVKNTFEGRGVLVDDGVLNATNLTVNNDYSSESFISAAMLTEYISYSCDY